MAILSRGKCNKKFIFWISGCGLRLRGGKFRGLCPSAICFFRETSSAPAVNRIKCLFAPVAAGEGRLFQSPPFGIGVFSARRESLQRSVRLQFCKAGIEKYMESVLTRWIERHPENASVLCRECIKNAFRLFPDLVSGPYLLLKFFVVFDF